MRTMTIAQLGNPMAATYDDTCSTVETDFNPLASYLAGVLRNEPVPPPVMCRDQWVSFLLQIGRSSIPLLYWKFKEAPSDLHPPRHVLDWMRIQFLASRVRSICVQNQLSELVSIFSLEEIAPLVFKGAALAQTVYANPALRYSGDIDILIRPEEFSRACDLLERCGYQSIDDIFDPTKKGHVAKSFAHSDHRKKYIPLDLHRDLHSCLRFSSETEIPALFARALRVESPGLSFLTLHPVDALIYASLHFTLLHQGSFRLTWIYDITLLAETFQGQRDWSRLQEGSVDMHARLAVERCLKLAGAWTGLRVPPPFDDFSTWPKAGPLERDMADHTSKWKQRTESAFKYYWPVSSGFKEKFWFLFRAFFPSIRYMRATHPSSRDGMLWKSYVKRWVKWIKRLKD